MGACVCLREEWQAAGRYDSAGYWYFGGKDEFPEIFVEWQEETNIFLFEKGQGLSRLKIIGPRLRSTAHHLHNFSAL
jgi:hypothetical protein